MVRSILLLVGLNLCLSASAVEPITKPGETSLFDGKLKVKVKDDGTTTQFDVTYIGSSGSHGVSAEMSSAKTAGWFVIAESANRIWLYKGGDFLTLIEISDNPPGGVRGTKGSVGELLAGQDNTTKALSKAPQAVLERLPASFKAPGKGK